jgi:hypothetical protein
MNWASLGSDGSTLYPRRQSFGKQRGKLGLWLEGQAKPSDLVQDISAAHCPILRRTKRVSREFILHSVNPDRDGPVSANAVTGKVPG